MSTFDGIVEEFPFIRIDYFRKNPDRPSPLACFLSHVHSDHLQGLESLRSPFIYCSAATRGLLLRIEKYPHRMNFNKGILESRKQHYKHLARLLRPIPLNTPTEIELTPRLRIRATLFDANHCLGAVMFLIEGDGKAVLYTGDIRSEMWWVNSLIRNPVLIPYTFGNKRLDKIYLDTTFAVKSDVYRNFPSKAEGLRELLEKVQAYPDGTVFYLRAWTFGYEEVWLALSAALNSKIHVDRYQKGLYEQLRSQDDGSKISEAAFLCGFELGNEFTSGCLTDDETCRIHSCEPGMFCPVVASGEAVYITPIVARSSNGGEVPEIGAGGGGGDLYQNHELELPDESSVEQLERLCLDYIQDPKILMQTKEALIEGFRSKKKALSLDKYGLKDEHDISLKRLVDALSHGQSFDTTGDTTLHEGRQNARGHGGSKRRLSRKITFPYSRHSSYTELCELISAFRPKDIYPCTVDSENWNGDVSMARLFGHLCSGSTFSHDKYMYKILSGNQRVRRRTPDADSSSAQLSEESSIRSSQTSYPHLFPTTEHLSLQQRSNTPSQTQYFNMNTQERIQYHENAKSVWQEYQENPGYETTPIPERTEKARRQRNRIRRTWYEIEELRRQEKWHFHNEPLPTWWPTEEEDQYTDEKWSDEQEDISGDSSLDTSLLVLERKPAESVHGKYIAFMTEMNSHAPIDEDAEIRHSQTSQLSISISVSESAFNSQELQPLNNTDYVIKNTLTNNDGNDNDDSSMFATEIDSSARSIGNGTNANNNNNNKRKRSVDVSIHNRIRAYHAARSGSWSNVSLLSAGNNHTEEEMEL